MSARRRSGILLHVSSLPGKHGSGDFGPTAYAFVDFLVRTRQTLWQVLPIGPIGYLGTPYQSPSAFAGNELFVCLKVLSEAGLLTEEELREGELFPATGVDFGRVPAWRRERLIAAFRRFTASGNVAEKRRLVEFRSAEASWLEDYALFMALKHRHGGAVWTSWDVDLVRRKPAALKAAAAELKDEIDAEVFIQFQFAEQWAALKRYANDHGIHIIGDVPIFVAHDSADVWSHQDLFYLDDRGRSTVVAGVPPDFFSATGQLWGNPLYRWDVMADHDYEWWIERLRCAFRQFDLVRIDHFRGFESYWEVPGVAETAIDGRWAPGPGIALFRAAERALGPLPIIAEDLGLITPAVDALRHQLGAPGMKVLQFAFGPDESAKVYLPHNYPRDCVVYSGTHDNDTTLGWFHAEPDDEGRVTADDLEAQRTRVLNYLGTDGRDISWDFIRLALGSVADTAIVPMQDVFGLGHDARMNLPGTADGNWSWRFTPSMVTPRLEARLRQLTETYQRTLPTFQAQDVLPAEERTHAGTRTTVV